MIDNHHESIRERLTPMTRGTGFRMPGYHVWCSAAIRVGEMYHLFAARWPNGKSYFHASEIVRATANRPEGPYQFQEIVFGKQAAGRFDSGMAHNPAVYRTREGFALFYIGIDEGGSWGDRRIGVATSEAIEGPWRRSDMPLDLGIDCDANNPAALIEADGSVKLIWRDMYLRVRISVAREIHGPYRLANDDVFPGVPLEDFFLYRRDGRYHLICEDNVGALTGHERWGAHLVSTDGITDWRPGDPLIMYDHTVRWTDGTVLHPVRRERPWLLIENGVATHLFTNCTMCREIDVPVAPEMESWSQPVRIEGGYSAEV